MSEKLDLVINLFEASREDRKAVQRCFMGDSTHDEEDRLAIEVLGKINALEKSLGELKEFLLS